jgi:lysophospholipid acyltransferase (LPLAT)-like uncharacterized protein
MRAGRLVSKPVLSSQHKVSRSLAESQPQVPTMDECCAASALLTSKTGKRLLSGRNGSQLGSCAHVSVTKSVMRIRPSPLFIRSVINGLNRTLHLHSFGVENLREAVRMSPTRTFIACHWHQNLLMMLVPRHGFQIATMASHSRDGELMSRYLTTLGIHPIRGSSSKGAATAVIGLINALRGGWNVALNVDGPRGPYKQVKRGSFEIARRCGVPLLPIAVRASREICIKQSWDHFRIPVPGSSIAICYGQPIIYPAETPGADVIEQRRRALACLLHDLEADATRRVGRNDTYPTTPQLSWLRTPLHHNQDQDNAL